MPWITTWRTRFIAINDNFDSSVVNILERRESVLERLVLHHIQRKNGVIEVTPLPENTQFS